MCVFYGNGRRKPKRMHHIFYVELFIRDEWVSKGCAFECKFGEKYVRIYLFMFCDFACDLNPHDHFRSRPDFEKENRTTYSSQIKLKLIDNAQWAIGS